MKSVEVKFYFKDETILNVLSDSGVYNNKTLDMVFEKNVKEVNLFITGVGNVGSELLNQLNSQEEYLKSNLNIKINVIAISNSRKMLFDSRGINLKNWKNFRVF